MATRSPAKKAADEQGANARRTIYGLSRGMKRQEIMAVTERRYAELLAKRGSIEEMVGWRGEMIALLVDARMHLDALEEGTT